MAKNLPPARMQRTVGLAQQGHADGRRLAPVPLHGSENSGTGAKPSPATRPGGATPTMRGPAQQKSPLDKKGGFGLQWALRGRQPDNMDECGPLQTCMKRSYAVGCKRIITQKGRLVNRNLKRRYCQISERSAARALPGRDTPTGDGSARFRCMGAKTAEPGRSRARRRGPAGRRPHSAAPVRYLQIGSGCPRWNPAANRVRRVWPAAGP